YQHEATGGGIGKRCTQFCLQGQNKPVSTHHWLNLTNHFIYIYLF
ncbi:LOW QUALITY PROTEIN: T0083559 isoform 1, partial [Pongo abelii]